MLCNLTNNRKKSIFMVEFTKKNIDISYEIKKYALKKRNFTYTEITTDLKRFGAKKTIYNNLQPFLSKDWIQKNEITRKYNINPYIKTWDKDPDFQIKEGKEKAIELLCKTKEKEEKLKFFTDFALNKEQDLRLRVMKNTQFSFDFKNNNLNKDVVFRKDTQEFLNNLVFSLIREVIIMNPETWKIFNKIEDFNFEFNIKCILDKDQGINELINQLKDEYIKIGRIPHSILTPFTREKIIELSFKKQSDIEEFFYKEALYDEYLKKREKERNEVFFKEFINFYNSLAPEYLELIKDLEIEKFDKERLSKIKEFFKKINPINLTESNSDIRENFIDIKNLLKDLLKKIKESEEEETNQFE